MSHRVWSRRIFLRATSLSMIALGAGGAPPFLGRLVAAANADGMRSRRKTLVTIFQRGAMDGVMAVPPLGDDGLRRLRPRLAMATAPPAPAPAPAVPAPCVRSRRAWWHPRPHPVAPRRRRGCAW